MQNLASTAAARATAEDVAAADVFAALALADDVAQAKSAPPLIGPASSLPLSFFFGWHHERASDREGDMMARRKEWHRDSLTGSIEASRNRRFRGNHKTPKRES